ncbi:MAG: hypothetical protein QXG46_01595 [Ignisphaera sp.]|uniref:Uncharacterized protein n=1 Tax=Ignisphaera aggregans TaxID=334771 RepID=A0A7C4H4N2_9CREN
MSDKRTKYKASIEKLGFKQLDIYRLKDRDIVRLMRKSDGKVYLVELPRHIEDMSLEEFIEQVTSKIR